MEFTQIARVPSCSYWDRPLNPEALKHVEDLLLLLRNPFQEVPLSSKTT